VIQRWLLTLNLIFKRLSHDDPGLVVAFFPLHTMAGKTRVYLVQKNMQEQLGIRSMATSITPTSASSNAPATLKEHLQCLRASKHVIHTSHVTISFFRSAGLTP
jgi:hypothetical protein